MTYFESPRMRVASAALLLGAGSYALAGCSGEQAPQEHDQDTTVVNGATPSRTAPVPATSVTPDIVPDGKPIGGRTNCAYGSEQTHWGSLPDSATKAQMVAWSKELGVGLPAIAFGRFGEYVECAMVVTAEDVEKSVQTASTSQGDPCLIVSVNNERPDGSDQFGNHSVNVVCPKL